MGFWGGLLSVAIPGVGAYLQGKAQNDASKRNYQLDLQRLLMDSQGQAFNQNVAREQVGAATASDAWRKLLATQYAQGGRQALPNVSPYATPQRSLAGLQPGADALTQELMKRLQGGNPIQPVTPFVPFANDKKKADEVKAAGGVWKMLTQR